MSIRTLFRTCLRGLALAAVGIAATAHASPQLSISFSPAGIRSGDKALLVIQFQTTTFQLTNATATINYPGFTNTGTVQNFCTDNPAVSVTATPGTSTLQVSQFNLTSAFFCYMYVEMLPQSTGSTTVTVPPGAFVDPNPANGASLTSTSATLCVSTPAVVTNANDSGAGSLRDALVTVGASCAAPQNIEFNIPGAGPHIIALATELPSVSISFGLEIDGYSQPGSVPNSVVPPSSNNAVIQVGLDGAACTGCSGIVTGTNTVVKGLAIYNFQADGIFLAGSSEASGNYVGVDPGGAPGRIGNSGIAADGFSNQVGDGTAAGTNLVGNALVGVKVTGYATIHGVQVGGTRSGASGNANFAGITVGVGATPGSAQGSIFDSVVQYNGSGIVGDPVGSSRFYVSGTSSFLNGTSPGIDINADGPTPNDDVTPPYDTDGILNYPTITSVVQAGGNTVIQGQIHTTSTGSTSGAYSLFANALARGVNEGQTLLGTFPFGPLDATGATTFTQTVAGTWDNISAQMTADTCGDGCTFSSEFSPPVAAAAAPAITVAPTALDFGTVQVGTTSAAQLVNVSHNSRNPLPITSITITGGYLDDASSCGTAIPVSGCTISVQFLPTAVATITGTLSVSAGGTTSSVSLTGVGAPTPVPVTSVAPASLTFAPRPVNTTSAASTVTVTNAGNANLLISSVTIAGDFSFASACPSSVAPAASCGIAVKSTPLALGPRSGVLSITSNGSASPVQVLLSGVGTGTAVGTLTVSTSSLDFDAVAVGGASGVQVVDVANSGTAPVSFSATAGGVFTLVAPPSSRSACPPLLGPGSACSLALMFTPTSAGTFTGNLIITSDASNPRIAVGLVGMGIVPLPTLALAVPAALDFGTQPFGVRSAPRTIVIANNTAQAVVVSDIALSSGSDFGLDDACPIVPALGTCAVNLTFLPSARGLRSADLAIRILSETAAYHVAITGQGLANPVPLLQVTPTTIGYGNALLGASGIPVQVVLTNVGEVPVSLGTLTGSPDFTTDNRCGATIAVGAKCAIFVSFFPRLTGVRPGVLSIESDALGHPHSVTLSGTACAVPTVQRARLAQPVCVP